MSGPDPAGDAAFPGLLVLVLTVDAPGGRRWRNAEHETGRAGLRAEFVRGHDSGDPLAARDYSPVRNLLFSRRSMTGGEIAVHAGHRRLWRRFLDSGHDAALILEDDLRITAVDRFRAALADCLAHPDAWGMVKFFDYRPKRVRRHRSLPRTRLVRHKYAASGAVCYLLNRETARRLLARRAFFRPVDEDLSWSWELGLDIWSVEPNPVAEAAEELGGSLLESGRVESRQRRHPLRAFWDIFLQGGKQVMARLRN